jgi:hypothetical protein
MNSPIHASGFPDTPGPNENEAVGLEWLTCYVWANVQPTWIVPPLLYLFLRPPDSSHPKTSAAVQVDHSSPTPSFSFGPGVSGKLLASEECRGVQARERRKPRKTGFAGAEEEAPNQSG